VYSDLNKWFGVCQKNYLDCYFRYLIIEYFLKLNRKVQICKRTLGQCVLKNNIILNP
jgi:hypothetical protein